MLTTQYYKLTKTPLFVNTFFCSDIFDRQTIHSGEQVKTSKWSGTMQQQIGSLKKKKQRRRVAVWSQHIIYRKHSSSWHLKILAEFLCPRVNPLSCWWGSSGQIQWVGAVEGNKSTSQELPSALERALKAPHPTHFQINTRTINCQEKPFRKTHCEWGLQRVSVNLLYIFSNVWKWTKIHILSDVAAAVV